MKKTLALLVSLLALASVPAGRLAAAESAALGCPIGLDWVGGFVNLSRPSTPFPTQDTALTNSPDCVFHQWSWEAFVWATAPSSNGVLRFMNLRTEDEFKLSVTAIRPHPGKLILKPRALKPPTMSRQVARSKALSLTGSAENVDEFLQASGGVLVDTNGNAVFYTVNMNDTYFNFAKKYITSNGYNTASASLNFPVGSAVFKSAWQVVPPGQTASYKSNFYVTAASVPMLTNSWVSGTNAGVVTVPGKTRDVTVALVGLHVVGVTTNHAEFVWGTFEQVSNAPFLPPGMSPTSNQPVSSTNSTFYQAGTSALNCNGNVYPSGFSVPPPTLQNYATQIFTPKNNVYLRHRYGGSNAENAYDIENLNKVSQAELVKLKSIFSNYELVGTVWMAPNSLSTNSSNVSTFGSTNLANSVMETFVQGTRLTPTYSNCFVCHSPQPKNINISHVVYFP